MPAGQQTHGQAVVGEAERFGLREVVVAGHSYSGIPVGQPTNRNRPMFSQPREPARVLHESAAGP